MHFGDIEVLPIHGGKFYLDGGAMFGVVPKTLWEKKAPADERNRIRLAANSLLLRAERKNILVETGNGTKWDPKLRNIYGIPDGDPLQGFARTRRRDARQKSTWSSTRTCTFDHAGGNTRPVGWPRCSLFSECAICCATRRTGTRHESYGTRPRQLFRRQDLCP